MSNCTWPVYHGANITFLSRQEAAPTIHMITSKQLRVYSWTSNSSIEVEKRETPHTLPTERCLIQHLECRKVVSTCDLTNTPKIISLKNQLFCVEADSTVSDNLGCTSFQGYKVSRSLNFSQTVSSYTWIYDPPLSVLWTDDSVAHQEFPTSNCKLFPMEV